ncbi:MAG TPA: long-chain fatty acid--CoA ligase [Terriglobia bacterium]|nr:long-chain fatty acid--CoA ligase [Terriglobia bacterium]
MPTSEPAQPSEFRTLTQLFLSAIDRHHKPDAFLVKSGGRYHGISSAEALTQAATLAAAFERCGIARGDRVGILSENRLEWALTDYALLGLGAISVPIYPTLLEPEVDYILRDSAAKGIVVSTAAELAKILNIHSRLPDLRLIVVMDAVSSTDGSVQDWQRLASSSDTPGRAGDPATAFRTRALAVRPEDTASILYTSGTTGALKGVVLTHSNIASNVAACEQLFALGERDVAMSFLPLSHIFERTLDYAYFWRGVSIGYAESYDTLAQNLLEVRPTVMAVVPRILQKVNEKVTEVVRQSSGAKQGLFGWALQVGRDRIPYSLRKQAPPLGMRAKLSLADKLVFAKVRERLGGRITTMISGAAPLSRELAEFFWAVGLPVYEGYGLTETSPVIAVNCPGAVKLGTVGRVISGIEVKLGEEIVDAEGRAGREILVRGPNVTPGYYHLDEENRQAFVDGWFYTGDLGFLDADGYLSITGRKRNLFKTTGGKFVSPEKIENLFQEHPYVSQIVVLGEGRKFVGALIVPNFARLESYARSQGLTFSSREDLVSKPEIHSFIEQQVEEASRWLPPHEKIRQFALLPREFTIVAGELSATLKIKRPVVEQRYRDLIEEIYQRHAPQAQSV